LIFEGVPAGDLQSVDLCDLLVLRVPWLSGDLAARSVQFGSDDCATAILGRARSRGAGTDREPGAPASWTASSLTGSAARGMTVGLGCEGRIA